MKIEVCVCKKILGLKCLLNVIFEIVELVAKKLLAKTPRKIRTSTLRACLITLFVFFGNTYEGKYV